MLLDIGFIILGFTLLIGGGNLLVDYATKLARFYGVRPAIIGVTIVAAGTSFPEVVVSFLAAMGGNGDIAVANVVGSNIANIAIVLGCSAFIYPIAVRGTLLKIEWPIMFVGSLLMLLFMRDFIIDPWEGAFLCLLAFLFTVLMVFLAKREKHKREAASVRPLSAYIFIALGLGLLVIGGRLALDGSIGVAKTLGLSERIIGLTIVALGTTLPEIVTSIIGALKKAQDLVVGNLIGSNIYNIFFVLGSSGAVREISVTPSILHFDVWFMLGFAFIIFPIMYFYKKIPRWMGFTLACGWVVYTYLLLYHS